MTTKRTLATVVGAAAAAMLVTFIPKEEGVSQVGYRDPLGIPTKCMGDTHDVVVGKTYTAAQCRASMEQALITHCSPVVESAPAIRAHPFALAAACSFTYNAGVAAWKHSDAYQHAKRGQWTDMCRALQIDDKGRAIFVTGRDRRTGQRIRLEGLVKRRALERLICEAGISNTQPWQPTPATRTEFNQLMRDYAQEAARPEYNLMDIAP
ncbi:glycoside hydrolase family protein [Uliginosibacterium gangwonense]|uniref:glycoside hydrolase family protein n=1 Tax=Uliginosibacterium gangwonense TaxID=392736 RepID=UPI00035DC9FB|nr:glycoside hydrolase family protein [Uliginosibacterium gangwonense]